MNTEQSGSKKILLYSFSLVLAAIGVYMLWSVDWKVAVGAFLFLWSNNIGRAIDRTGY